jgi:hypothetical protein
VRTADAAPLVAVNRTPAAAAAPRAAAWRSVWKRRIAKYSRWLHVYVSMASFVVVFFFAVTGLTLNHTEWFDGQERVLELHGAVDPAWTRTATDDGVRRLEIVEHLRQANAIQGAVSDFRVDDSQVSVSFKAPGYAADAFIDRDTGTYDLTETRMGFAAVVNDLHKGRDAGPAWKLLIDVSALLLTFVSLSGLVLIYFIHKHRFAGLMSLAAGAALAAVIYAWLVP